MNVFRSIFGGRSPQSQPHRQFQTGRQPPFDRTYQVISSASVEILWQMLTNLADVSWHPLIDSTNAPHGIVVKPGLIYRVIPRWFPVPMRVFVERVLPQELLSVRIFPMPGVEERVIYRLESTVWGTRISYSVAVRGWLSPVAWSVLKPQAAQMARAIAQAAEETAAKALPQAQSNSEAY